MGVLVDYRCSLFSFPALARLYISVLDLCVTSVLFTCWKVRMCAYGDYRTTYAPSEYHPSKFETVPLSVLEFFQRLSRLTGFQVPLAHLSLCSLYFFMALEF